VKQPSPPSRRFADLPAPGWMAVCRGAALGLCVLVVLNLAEIIVHSTSAVDNWFCNLQPMPNQVALAVLAMAATCLLLFAVRPALPGPVWFSAGALVLVFVAGCGREIWQIQQTVPEMDRITAMIKPLGIAMLFIVAAIGILTGNSSAVQGRSSFIAITISACLAFVSFTVVEVQSGGLSDPLPETIVPLALIPGCSLHTDGAATDELTDRVNTGVAMLNDRKARKLFLSGGAGQGGVTEGEAMRAVAMAAGIDETNLLVDEEDSTMPLSVASLSRQPELKDKRDAIIISHWYELARCRRLARQNGLNPIGIAAEQKHALFNQNILVAKEVVSLMKTLYEPAVQLVRGTAPVSQPSASSDESGDEKHSATDLDDELENLKSMEL
jgi:vancomycin permeability regulator SanA